MNMCLDVGCGKLCEPDGCTVYSHEGQEFRCRQGYCPIPDDGPNRKEPKVDPKKIRVGQRKQKKR